MTTTVHLDRSGLQDWYAERDACELSVKGSYAKSPTNPRYKNFKQGIFTAGDEEQFEEFRDARTYNIDEKTVNVPRKILIPEIWEGFHNIHASSVTNTFRYIFHKLKKGLFVKIANGELKVFLPFSKDAYVNEWGGQITSNTDHIYSIFRKVSNLDARRFYPKGVSTNPRFWYGNNGLIRYESPMAENDTNLSTLRDMIKTLCSERELPDIEFFINRRDFPLKKKTATEPYDNIWDRDDKELVSHKYDKYAPIMSMSSSETYADVLIPTFEDWARVEQPRGKWFAYCCRDLNVEHLTTKWEDKKPTAVFRGGSTGIGVTIDTNMRLKAASLTNSVYNQCPDDGILLPYLDAGITNWNVRPRKIKGDKDLHVIDYNAMNISLVSKLSMLEQSKFKYILHLQGHVSAFRLSYELGMGCVILLVDSQWRLWFSHLLIPNVHFVPVKSDLSDLFDKIRWCRAHDDECQRIAMNAKSFYDEHLCRESVLDYLQNTLVQVKERSGQYFYPNNSLLDHQLEAEKIHIDNLPPFDVNLTETINTHYVPKTPRCHSTLEALGWVLSEDLKRECLVCGQETQIAINKLGVVLKTSYAGMAIVRKYTTSLKKMREHAHEIFVGIKGVNRIIKSIPNFAYTFGGAVTSEGASVYTEFISGGSFDEYLRSKRCTIVDVIGILMQVCLALEVAQNTCGFVHMDLMPWNIQIQVLKECCVRVPYLLSDTVVTAKTKLVPVIIDFGKSHIVYEGRYHGFIRLYQSSRIQDVVTLLVQTLNILKDVRLTHAEFPVLLQIANFLAMNPDTGKTTGNSYCPTRFTTAKEMKRWLSENKSYGNLTMDDKRELEKLSPRDLFGYLKYIHTSMNTESTSMVSFDMASNNYTSCMDRGNSLQVYHYIRSGTEDERYSSYRTWFEQMNSCILPSPSNLLFVYYACQSLWLSVSSTYNVALKTKYVDEEIDILYNEVLARIEHKYRPLLSLAPMTITCDLELDTNMVGNYSDDIFSNPKEVESQLREIGMNNLSHYQTTLWHIFSSDGPYALPLDVKTFYSDNLRCLLELPTHDLLNNWARNITLHIVSNEIYGDMIRRIDYDISDKGLSRTKYALSYRDACLNVLDLGRKLTKKENISVH